MATVDLNSLFPEAADGTRSALPKQTEFLNAVLDPNGPKNIAYFGGYGSGKSLILVIAMITQGVIFGGEFVIARHFMPELRRTTMKLFKEMLPPDLLVEWKDAVAECVIKSAKGTARFYFVGLDEPEKLDSLTLDGFGIDEASQTTEEAFLKLQGRLRGTKGLRKSLLVGNPKGHDYIYRNFIDQRHFQDYTDPKTKKLITAAEQRSWYKLIVAPSTENRHLPSDYLQRMFSSYSKERMMRDVYGSFDSFEGQVFSEFNRAVHVVRPFRIPDSWERHIRIDHGFRNPAACLWFAISPDGEVYVYREYYKSERIIKEIMNGKDASEYGIIRMTGTDKLSTAKIDPSTKARRGQTGASDFDEYLRYWPTEWPPLQGARNDVQVGIDRVKNYLKVDEKTNKPLLFIFETCSNLLEEITTYKYQELRPSQEGKRSESEKPLKVDDHAVDSLRYMIVDLPERYKIESSELERKKKYSTIELRLQDELKNLRNPKLKDPFGF